VLLTTQGRRELVFATLRRITGVDFDSGALLWSVDAPAREVVSSLAMDGSRLFLAGGSAKGVVMAVELLHGDSSVVPQVLWEQDAPSMISSPVASDGLLFSLTEDAELTCRRLSNGHTLWSEIISSSPCYASIVLAGTNLYVVDSSGTISFCRAAATFQKCGEYNLNEVVYATPALANGNLLVRTETHLYCLR
jgi:outer membrane protein assembly factor BamB